MAIHRAALLALALATVTRPHPASAGRGAASAPARAPEPVTLAPVAVEADLPGPGAATPVTMAEVRADLRGAWRERFGADPPDTALAMLSAHVAHETARGAAVRSYNLGNVGCRDGWASRTIEYVAGRPTRAVARWCRYADRTHAARAFLAVVLDLPVMRAATAGDATGYAHGLARAGYYTAPEADYAAALGPIYHEQLGAVRRERGARQ